MTINTTTNILDELFPRDAMLDEYTEEMWHERFKPLCIYEEKSYIFDISNESEGGFLRSIDHHYVWTFVECENGVYAILPGFRNVNKLHHHVTLLPWSDSEYSSIVYCYDN